MNIRLISLAAAASLALAGCATTSPGYGGGYNNPPPPSYGSSNSACYDCGQVIAIQRVAGTGAPRATGAILGGIVGAAVGREIADDHTDSKGRKNTATVAGAAAGALAGNAIQNRTTSAENDITVRMNDGRTVTIRQTDMNGIRQGAYVRVYNNHVWPQ
ncbi:glycine zipper 2TM domain-containing protein [Luteimonas sp. SX5]|uniref:Glycine zipper 2TM domain-containing protein n=1 Tax=Luteimonas galliterrae TaxID=2940486 RepID=A0ABT0MF40_9GAMM|nr:glycine zipper 2TM domain-containing protein [Luteimonas galliterrae]MCL1633476.1 glycine zipper 2TM domain-containing protein [Luteimonas galliterrae]